MADRIACACAVALCSVVVLVAVASARTLYPRQWAAVSPEERDWFKAQKSRDGVPCCDDADGTYAEEDLRQGSYWARFGWKRCLTPKGDLIAPSKYVECRDETTEWMRVPDEAVIHSPNRHGAPVVWWAVKDNGVWIRCYAPGGKF